MEDNPLSTLRADIETHWRVHLPRMVAELDADGLLSEAIGTAVRETQTAVLDAVARGMPFWEAWTTYREQWAFLPAEETAADEEDDHWLTDVGFFDEDYDLADILAVDDEGDSADDLGTFLAEAKVANDRE